MSTKQSYVGIDLSYTSPAFTVWYPETKQSHCYYMTKVKRCQGIFKAKNFTFEGIAPPDTKMLGSLRYKGVTDWITSVLSTVHSDSRHILIEGYSMGSRGSRTFEIGENTGMLKYALLSNDYNMVVKTPTEIKKFATGNGGSGKFSMEKFFKMENGFDIRDTILSKAENPVSDIIDSYWMSRMCEKAFTVS